MTKKHSKRKSNMKKVVAAGAATAVLAGGLCFQTYQVHQLEEDLMKFDKKYSQTVLELHDTANKYEKLLLANEQTKAELEEVTVNFNSVIESNLSLQQQIEEKQSLIDNKDKEANELRSQVSSLEQQLETAKKTIASTPKTSNVVQNTSTSNKNASSSSVKATYTMSARAYTTASNGDPNTSGKWGSVTASGTTPKQGRTIAVDKNIIPLGSKVKLTFPSGWEHLNGVFIAEDTGSAINGMKIDVFFNSYNACIQFGKQTVKLEVLN